MDLRVLRYFLAVAKEQSFSRAAAFVHITQPSLSRQIMDLEKELQAKLFHRGAKNRAVTLTSDGLLLRQRAEELVALADQTKAAFSTPDRFTAGDVYIGGGETEGMRVVARAARVLQKQYPLVRYHLYSANAEDVTARLDKGLLDFGVLVGAAHLEKYDYIRLPGADRWGLLMHKDHPLAQKKTIRAKDLQNENLLVSRQALAHNELAGWCGDYADGLKITGTYNLVYNAALMVEEGVGSALILARLVNTKDRPLRFRPLQPALQTHLYLAWKKRQLLGKTAELFLKRLRHMANI